MHKLTNIPTEVISGEGVVLSLRQNGSDFFHLFIFFIQPCYAITHKYTQTHVQHSCRSSPPKDKNSCTRNEAGQEGISAQLQLDVQPPPQPFTFSLKVPQKDSNLSG